jgi:Tfp pilus assembly protein PilF
LSRQEEERRQQRTQADNLARQAGELLRENRVNQALELLEQAITRDPSNGRAHAQLAKILLSAGRPNEARQAFERTTVVNPSDADAFFQMGVIHQRLRDLERAITAFRKAVELSPGDQDYRAALSAAMRDRKD